MSEFSISAFLKTLPESPGVYLMHNQQGTIIYVGKAKRLKRRVSSYFQKQHLEIKTQQLVNNIHHIEVVLTENETEALLLENNLIKKHRPKYNVLFKDDKSYPYIYLSTHQDYPKCIGLRGHPHKKGRYLGPYPSLNSLKSTLILLQKIFRLRNCEDTVFKARSRPCLQYQIGRCSAPCVKMIAEKEYQADVQHCISFLEGRSHEVISALVGKMVEASEAEVFELAARYRDQIQELKALQTQQSVCTETAVDVDVIALGEVVGQYSIDVLFIRKGEVVGNKTYYPQVGLENTASDIISQFVTGFYLDGFGSTYIPSEVVLSHPLQGEPSLSQLLEQTHQKVPLWKTVVRQKRKQWLKMAQENANAALSQKLKQIDVLEIQFSSLEKILKCSPIKRMACFDISHSLGECTTASFVVMEREGHNKRAYRHYKIKDVQPGDDYAAIHQAVFRRFKKLKGQPLAMPDVLLIDGGKGQLKSAHEALDELSIALPVIGISKGIERKAGHERLYIGKQGAPLFISPDEPGFSAIMQCRDEAHRFALKHHRKGRIKKRFTSVLETIPGIGPQRRQALLNHFGGLESLKQAPISSIEKVPGFSESLARLVFEALKAN